MRARRNFYDIRDGCLDMEDGIRIKTAWLNHPRPAWASAWKRVDGVLVYATANEPGDAVLNKGVR